VRASTVTLAIAIRYHEDVLAFRFKLSTTAGDAIKFERTVLLTLATTPKQKVLHPALFANFRVSLVVSRAPPLVRHH
jgi:hypothetical protein